MRRGLVFVLAIGLWAVLGVAADDKKPDEKQLDPDLKKLQGKWEITYHETAGTEDTKEAKWVLVVAGDKWTVTDADGITKGTIRLDSTKKPKQLSYTITGENGDEEFIGIYELDGDTYKTCDVAKGKDRPAEFKTNESTGQVATWKRVKAKD